MGKTIAKGTGLGNQRLKGENFYHDRKKVAYLNMLKTGKPIRNKHGKIVKAAAFQSSEAPIARVLPNRKWFGNTRVIGQQALSEFREKLSSKINDPYQVLLRANKLPMSLLTTKATKNNRVDFSQNSANPNNSDYVAGKDNDQVIFNRPKILETSSFNCTFGPKSTRKKPTISHESLSQLADNATQNIDDYQPEKDTNLVVDRDYVDQVKDWYFGAGTSKRIWNELYKVIDSSDVVIHVLDARDPIGTRCLHIENYLKKEAPHKHLIYVLNKVDLVPNWVTSRWVKILSRDRPTIAFHASVNNSFGKGTLIQLLRQFSKLHSDKKQISVGFIGYPNTGKSSIINTLRKKKVCTVAPIPGETKVWQYITLMRRIYLIDCPGIVQSSNTDTQSDIVLKGSIRTNLLQNPSDYVEDILSKRVKPEYIVKTYNIENWSDHEDFLTMLAKATGKLGKGGEPDMHVVSIMVINDFFRGKLPHFVEPPRIDKSQDNEDSENESKNVELNVVQEFNKIPMALEYYENDLQNNSELVEESGVTAGEELTSEEVPKTKSNKRTRSQKSAHTEGSLDIDQVKQVVDSYKKEVKISEAENEHNWDDIFSNLVGETVDSIPEDPRTFEKNIDDDSAQADSELDSDFETNDNDSSNAAKNSSVPTKKIKTSANAAKNSSVPTKKSNAGKSTTAADISGETKSTPGTKAVNDRKAERLTTNKAKAKNFYSVTNVKNKNKSNKQSKPVDPDTAVKKLRKPGSWKVNSK
ncbi:hypothetical protein BB561_006447 [Smittium simulii]|uniref:Nucleolar GTP-binding protein 2 n=1 Tax=Smittium simulii TaxID=133385 RepID=A0A2T9Y444_9FUNG|nr:hypothetical protein BB561_006796 [Smittium simulii]PVU87119.1 hypothetical protein BB561_006447 [Smittium simulii]